MTDELERRLAEGPVIGVPTITLDGDPDGVASASDGIAYGKKFSAGVGGSISGHGACRVVQALLHALLLQRDVGRFLGIAFLR